MPAATTTIIDYFEGVFSSRDVFTNYVETG